VSRDQESRGSEPGRSFDPVGKAWFFPVILLAFFAAVRAFLPQVAERPEFLWLDRILQARDALDRARPLHSSIRFVELSMNDEIARRFAEDGEYATAADLLETIASLGVRVIAVDIIYTWGRAEDQRQLAESIVEIEDAGRTSVVLPMSIEHHADPPHLLRSLPAAGGDRFPAGLVNVTPDDHWRQYRYVRRFERRTLPSLALAALGASRPYPLAPKVTDPGVMEWKTLDERGRVATSQANDERVFLNLPHSYYDGTYDRRAGIDYRVLTIETLEELAERVDAGEPSPWHDTIVFFGYGAEVDGKPTAHGDQEPGMFLHGVALSNLLRDAAIRPTSPAVDVAIYAIVALIASLCFALLAHKRRLLLAAAAGLFLIAGMGAVGIVAFHRLLPAVNPALLWIAAVVCEIGRRWTHEQRERTQRDAMLGFYFSPAVLKQVTRDLDMIRPQGSEVAILLSDLRGFTTLCETQPVERVFELLNRLFGVETEAALRENGSLARFAGDQFLAYWGAPEPCADAADRALRAAVAIQTTLRERRDAADAEDDPDAWLRIGVGLHYGRGLVGHVGSRSYRDYNIVGDSVNTTARVEGQTKNYAAPILATGEFMTELSAPPASLRVDCVQVKGKSRATELHAILLDSDAATEESRRRYGAAFDRYQAAAFGEAGAAFEELADDPNETIATSAALLALRCREFAARPPVDWDGVFELRSK